MRSLTGGIDRLEVRIPETAMLTVRAQDAIRLTRPWPGGRYYKYRLDLRAHGFDAVLHYSNRRTGTHKLEIVGVGTMVLSTILAGISAIYHVDVMTLPIMRIDLAADVPGYSVQWFYENARLKRARYTYEHGVTIDAIKTLETLILGKRPNLIRFYDKDRQLQSEKKKKGNAHLTGHFQFFSGPALTRVERQYGAGRIPEELKTLGDVCRNARTFNPFSSVSFSPSTISVPRPEDFPDKDFVKAYGVHRLIQDVGYQKAFSILREKTSRNAERQLRKICDNDVQVDKKPPDLNSIYQHAIVEQMLTGTNGEFQISPARRTTVSRPQVLGPLTD